MAETVELEGRYFPAGGSHSFSAVLRVLDGRCSVIAAESGEVTSVEFSELGDRIGNVPRKVFFDDGSIFESRDNDAIDLAFSKSGHLFSRLSRLELSWKFAAIAFLLTAGLIFSIYRFGLPLIAQVAAWATPSTVVSAIDASALDTVDRVFFNPSELAEDKQAQYKTIFTELVDASGASKDELQLLFRDGGRMGANAVALPGGTVILTDQLVALSEHEDEIAGVLAHEIGHYTGRHSLRQIYRALGIGFMVAIVVGDTSQLLDNVVGQAALIDTLSYSRKFELEADSTSVEIMQAVGRNPVAFVDLIDRVFAVAGVDGDDSGWLSTHPGNEDRRENVLRQLE